MRASQHRHCCPLLYTQMPSSGYWFNILNMHELTPTKTNNLNLYRPEIRINKLQHFSSMIT
jgi:hypothetical protein